MNIKNTLRNGLIGITAIVASSCSEIARSAGGKVSFEGKEYTVVRSGFGDYSHISKTVFNSDSSKVYMIKIGDLNNDGKVDRVNKILIIEHEKYVKGIYTYLPITSSAQEEFDKVMKIYNAKFD